MASGIQSELHDECEHTIGLKRNNIDSTRHVSLSMNEPTAEYWNSYVI